MKTHLTLLLLLLSFNGQAALYKSIDANGQVTYSDRPSLKTDKPLLLPSQNIMQSINSKTPNEADKTDKTDTSSQNKNYQSLQILSPKNDSTLRSNNGEISLILQLEPKLQTQHQIRILLDGKEVKLSHSLITAVPNVSRGQHSLSAQVIDADQHILISSPAHTLHLQRHSKLF
ncbi:MAG: DUF4124 domain-containing protein [Gammaproteobacteria bacterium]|nr:DUF4124 domain-containing protein [Gammaproteobacteria bacterium]